MQQQTRTSQEALAELGVPTLLGLALAWELGSKFLLK